jgi:hypothetical protein
MLPDEVPDVGELPLAGDSPMAKIVAIATPRRLG